MKISISSQNYTLSNALNIAIKVKELDRSKIIILGGVGVHGIGEEILRRFNCVNYIVSGEREKTIAALIEYILGNSEKIPVGVGFLEWREKF